MARRKSRILAFQALYAWDAGMKDTDDLLSLQWASAEQLERIGEDGRAFARLIVSGTLSHIEQIDGAIKERLVNWEIERLNKVGLAVLRMSVYSLMFQKESLLCAKEAPGNENASACAPRYRLCVCAAVRVHVDFLYRRLFFNFIYRQIK